jgi:hypothetical protein
MEYPKYLAREYLDRAINALCVARAVTVDTEIKMKLQTITNETVTLKNKLK